MWRSAVQLCTGLRGISSVGLEHLLCKQGVKGSTPLFSTGKRRGIQNRAGNHKNKRALRGPKKKKEQTRSHPGAEAPGLCPAARRAEETIDMLKTKKDENVEYESARGGGLTSRRVGEGKESKGGRWIPRLQEARKDVASDEMPWGGASGL